jgi:hypothetical protein
VVIELSRTTWPLYNSVLAEPVEVHMKTGLLLVSLISLSAVTPAQQKTDLGLPELNVVRTAVLSPSYGCRSEDDFSQGYGATALFLSKYSRQRNSPDLLFNGACKAEDDFEGPMAGDDMSLIADLGVVPLEDVSSSRAFNFRRIHSFDLYSKFAQQARVQPHHTYALLINTRETRGLFVFTLDDYQPNRKVAISYAVKEYEILDVKAESKGFDWEAQNRLAETRWIF